MITLGIGEIGDDRNGLLCMMSDDDEIIIEQRPLGLMFRDFIMELKATENEEVFNSFAEKIKGDLQMGIDFIERLQVHIGTDSVH